MNKYHAKPARGGAPNPGTMGGRKGGKGGSLREKPGFPGADLPGKAQRADRSGGVPRCKTHPDKKGI